MGCVRTITFRPATLRTIVVRNGLRTIAVNSHGLRTIIVPRTISLRPISFSDSFLARVRVTVTPVSNGVARAVAVRPVFVRPVQVVRPVALRTIRVLGPVSVRTTKVC